MAAKNKVKKVSFTELYLINKKTLNLLKKKKKEVTNNIHQNPLTSHTPTIYQTHHHYVTPQSFPGNHDSINPSSENTFSNSEVGNDDEYFDDNLEDLYANESLPEENEDAGDNFQDNDPRINNIPLISNPENIHNIPQTLQREEIEDNIIIENPLQEDMDDIVENTQKVPVEILDYNNLNNYHQNIDYLNQSKRASYFKRKRGGKSDINVIKSVLRGEIRNMREKSREKKINAIREKPGKNHKPPIVINSPNNNTVLRVLPPSSTSVNNHTLNNVVSRALTQNHVRPVANNNRSQIMIQRIPVRSILNNVESHELTPNPASSSIPIPVLNNNLSQVIQQIPTRRPSQIIAANTVINRKRATPSNTLVKNPVNSDVEYMETESTSNTINSKSKNAKDQNTAKNTYKQPPPRTKIHKKSKVIIIDAPEVDKPKNSEFVDKILQSNVNDPYDVFQFSKTSRITYSGLKRKFNAFSKKLHPDKEPSPGAHEAFIIMRRAFMQLKKEIQIRDELEKEKTQTKKKQTSPQTGFGIKKWMKLCK